MNRILGSMSEKIAEAIYPNNIYCMRCGDTIDSSRLHGLCDNCVQFIPWATKNPFGSYMEEFAFDDVWPVTRYGSAVRGMIHSLKLYGKTYMARNMGTLLAERALMENIEYDALVSVPLYKDKERARGYNQADLLAVYASKALASPYWNRGLEKSCETGSMRMADSVTRRSMLTGAFRVPIEYVHKMQGAHILLVDDVCTTGSTADACARTLKDAGARRVTLLCFAASSGYRQFQEGENIQ